MSMFVKDSGLKRKTTLKEKIQDVSIVSSEIKRLQSKLAQANKDFRCTVESSKVILNESGAHIINAAPTTCRTFNSDVLCEKTDCKNYEWAQNYIGLQKRLQQARTVRQDLLCEYFWVLKKCRQLKECIKLNDAVKVKRREVFHNFCETLYDSDESESRDQRLQKASGVYESMLAQRDAARARFWGREK